MKHAISAFLALALLFVGCGGGAATPAGKYTLKIDPATVAEMEKELEKAPDMAKKMLAPMVQMMKDMKGSFDLKGDGSFSASMTAPDGEHTMKGTWKLEGDQITMTSTHQDGKEKAETKTGTWKDGKITITEDQGGKKINMILEPGS